MEPKEARFHSLLGDIANVDDRLPGAQRHYRNAIRLNDSFFYHTTKRLSEPGPGRVGRRKAQS